MSGKEACKPFTCCSFNVHHFATAHGRHNLPELYKYLHEKNFDIVCLNEVYQDNQFSHPLQDLVSNLNNNLPEDADSAKQYQCRSGHTDYEANIILSKYPILFKQAKDVGRGERSILGLKIDHPYIRNVFVTHLDHVRETKRVSQLRNVLSFIHYFINRNLGPNADDGNRNFILLGDFNSMRMDDYTDNFWNFLIQQRIQFGWEAPDTQVTSILFNEPTEEQDDGVNLKLPLIDCWKTVNNEVKFDGEQGTGSSRLNTRIDYIISNAELLPYLKNSWIDEDAAGISDHMPVVAVFEF